jgi:cell fate regulator YaaT (PSP1 superfamily)
MPDIIEVEFKGDRRLCFSNPHGLETKVGDRIVVQVEKGEDLGTVVRKGCPPEGDPPDASYPPVLRLANDEELKVARQLRNRETDALMVCRERILALELPMKLVDIEMQFDGGRMCLYFTAERRVDFRGLVRDLAAIFRTRVEMHQIGAREEARRVSGYGPCGRKLCCATFLRDFEPVTIKMAKEQNPSTAPTKMSGVCGRLVCCLWYERWFYDDAHHRFPKIGATVSSPKGPARVTRIDLFREHLYLTHEDSTQEIISIDRLAKDKRGHWQISQ